MIYYVLLPFFSLFVLILQVGVLDIVFLGKATPEISLIVVIYAGFYLSALRGGVLSVILGYCMDCLTGVVPGLFVISYFLIFMISRFVSFRAYVGGVIFAATFTVMSVFLEKFLIILIYNMLFGINVLYDMLDVALIQAVATGVLAPVFFALFRRIEGVLSAWESKSPGEL